VGPGLDDDDEGDVDLGWGVSAGPSARFGVQLARCDDCAALLLLAATSFTIVSGLHDGAFSWNYYQYVSLSGWRHPYQFPYSLPLVLTYLAAYCVGIFGYGWTWRSGFKIVGSVGTLLCAIGFLSFAYELTHWFGDHNGTWIASAPIVLLPLALIAVVVQCRARERNRDCLTQTFGAGGIEPPISSPA
jgi:hypothetical protein